MPTKTNLQTTFAPNLLKDLRDIIASGRAVAYASVNAAMIDTYWKIGRRIVEEEQHGSRRAEYGTGLIDHLAEQLSPEFGNGFSARNLAYYKRFYQFFPDPTILERARSKSSLDSFSVPAQGRRSTGAHLVYE